MTQRLCKTCESIFDDADENLEVLVLGRSGITTVRDRKTQLVHVLVSEAKTRRWLAKQQAATAETVTIFRKPEKAPEVAAPSPSDFEDEVFLKLIHAAAKDKAHRQVELNPPSITNSDTHPTEVDVEAKVLAEPEWSPQPDEWFEAHIISVPGIEFFFAKLSNGEGVYCYSRYISNGPNGHMCGVQVGDDVAVRLELSRPGSKRKWAATEISLLKEHAVPQPPETGTVFHWFENGRSGFIHRDCPGKCQIFVQLSEEVSIQKGDRVEVDGYILDPQGRLEATICQPLLYSTSLISEENYEEEL